MAIMPRLVASILRILQLVCAAIECGLVVIYMSIVHRLAVPASPAFIFTGVVAILSLLTATLFLILMSLNFKRYPYDLAISTPSTGAAPQYTVQRGASTSWPLPSSASYVESFGSILSLRYV
ncbi:MAG: hypothetical protein M4579_002860 [Chaenotheca gracillima]|nr:MAG: hypothetical protein M4579_002860 [Chaenotheca gracillima]